MPLLKAGKFTEDSWTHLTSGDALQSGNIIISLSDYMANKEEFIRRDDALGIQIPNDIDVFTLRGELENVDLIVVEFPAFPDGRAYSQARQLRSELSFQGEIRAIGNILPDQLSFMRQCGIDAFVVDDRYSEKTWQKIMTDMSLSYQEDFVPVHGSGPSTILARRKQARQ